MSIHACRECGGPASSEASSCPHCGAPRPALAIQSHGRAPAVVMAPASGTSASAMPLWVRGAVMGAGFFVSHAIVTHQPFAVDRLIIFVVVSMVLYPLVTKLLKVIFS